MNLQYTIYGADFADLPLFAPRVTTVRIAQLRTQRDALHAALRSAARDEALDMQDDIDWITDELEELGDTER
jgi:hypothetical protein